jgi:glycosyltransferase involved in cell wall biosynthesis
MEETQLRKELGLENKKVILGVSAYWTKEKGLDDFIALSKRLDSRYAVVLIGNVEQEKIEGTNILHIPPVTDAKTLARYYNMADVFVNASVQETFGLTTAEALACGTPCVVYNKTACPELIGEGCGYVVQDFEGLLKQVCSILGGGKEVFSKTCRMYAETMFDMETNVRKYIDLYGLNIRRKGE